MSTHALSKETWTVRDRSTGERRTVLVIHYSADEPTPVTPPQVVDVARYCLSTMFARTCWLDANHAGPHSYDDDPRVVAERAEVRRIEATLPIGEEGAPKR